MSTDNKTRIQQIIQDSNLSQKEFAAKYGFTYDRVFQWNKGVASPPDYLCNWLERAAQLGLEVTSTDEYPVPETVKNSGLPATEVAKLYNIPQVTFQTWASGKKRPPAYIETYLKIFLDIDKDAVPTDPDILDVLQKHDLTTAQFTKRYDIPRSTVNNWIYGYNKPAAWLVNMIDRLLTLDK